MENKEITKTVKTTSKSKGTSRKETGGSSAVMNNVQTESKPIKEDIIESSVKSESSSTKSESPVAEQVKKRPQLDLSDNVAVYNMTPGRLIYSSRRNFGYEVEWERYGDFQYIELRELVNMKSSQRIFFEENWVYIEDPDVREYLGITKYYAKAISPVDVDDIFEMPVDDMVQKIKSLSEDVKASVLKVAIEKFGNNEIESYSRVKALEDVFDYKFD